MPVKMAKRLALISGAVLIAASLLAYVPNPVIGPGGMLGRFAPLPLLYTGIGFTLLLISLGGESAAAMGLYGAGAVAIIIAAAATAQVDGSGTAPLTEGLRMAKSDIIFTALLGVTFVAFGKMNTARKQLMWE